MKDFDNADTELLIYATSLINKTLCGLGDQDTFYDETDCLENQGMESIIQKYMSKPNTDLDLLDQFQIYESALRLEDGLSEDILCLPGDAIRKTPRHQSENADSRKSKRFSNSLVSPPPVPPLPIPSLPAMLPPPPPPPPPLPSFLIVPKIASVGFSSQIKKNQQEDDDDSSSSGDVGGIFQDCKREGVTGVTPGLRKRREKNMMREHELSIKTQNKGKSGECGNR